MYLSRFLSSETRTLALKTQISILSFSHQSNLVSFSLEEKEEKKEHIRSTQDVQIIKLIDRIIIIIA